MEYLLDILGRIGFDWQVALANLVNFLIIYWILKRYAFKPIQEVIKKRRDAINEGLDQAQHAEAELLMAKEKSDAIISQAKQEANALVTKAKERGDELVKEAEAKAQITHDEIIQSGHRQVENERAAAEEELRRQTAGLITHGVRQIIGETLTDTQDSEITKKALNTVA